MSEARVFERSNVPLTLSMKTIGPPSMTSATSRLSISCLSFPGVKGFGGTAYAMALMARANKPLPEPAPLICGAFRRRPGASDRLCRQTAVNRPFRKPLSSIPIGALKSTTSTFRLASNRRLNPRKEMSETPCGGSLMLRPHLLCLACPVAPASERCSNRDRHAGHTLHRSEFLHPPKAAANSLFRLIWGAPIRQTYPGKGRRPDRAGSRSLRSSWGGNRRVTCAPHRGSSARPQSAIHYRRV